MRALTIAYFCLLRRICGHVNFHTQYSLDGDCTFREGTVATFVCTHTPCTGINTFFYDSTKVYDCTGSTCSTLNTDNGTFTFSNDKQCGTYTWVINRVKMEHDGKVFQCTGGSTNANCKATVKGATSNGYHQYSVFWWPQIVNSLLCIHLLCQRIITKTAKMF